MCELYEIRCNVNNRRYVGISVNSSNRWKQHKRSLRNNKHHCTHLQRSWNKYGEHTFTFVVLQHYSSRDEAAKAELSLLLSDNTLMNSDRSNDVGGTVSDEQRRYISERTKEAMNRPEVKAKLGSGLRGKTSPRKGVINPNAKRHQKRSTRGSPEWKSAIATKNATKVWSGLTRPDGTEVTPFVNLTGFAKREGLVVQGLHNLFAGKANSYRGWTYNASQI